MPPKKPRGPAGPKAHQLAEQMPPGEVLQDLMKGRWRLGAKLGQGGFGLIYFAQPESASVKAEPTYVVKQEPSGNGPLALECIFYAAALKADKLEAWAKSKRVVNLGLPKFVGWGMHAFRGKPNRFLVMERFGADLQKLFETRGTFSRLQVAQMALRLIDALHYLHDNRFVHADIKAANILLPYSQTTKKQPSTTKTVYLVDFGLTTKFSDSDGVHKPYKQDPRRAHDGTVEFTSRDAHMGVTPSRRSDMEILGYCLVQWLCGRLPWEDKLTDKNYVADQKCKYMKDIPAFMKKCFPAKTAAAAAKGKGKGGGGGGLESPPLEIQKYLQLVDELEYSEEPDYNQFKEFFKSYLRSRNVSSEAPIDLSAAVSSSSLGAASSAPLPPTPTTPKRGAAAAAIKASASVPSKLSSAGRGSKTNVLPTPALVDAVAADSMSVDFPSSTTSLTASKSSTSTSRKRGGGAAAKKDAFVIDDDNEDTVALSHIPKSPAAKKKSASSSFTKASTAASASSSTSSKTTSAASSATISVSSSSSTTSSSRSSRKRPNEEIRKKIVVEDEEGEKVEETEPLREVSMNGKKNEELPQPPAKKKPRTIKVRKNVAKTDSGTQTTPKHNMTTRR